MNVPKTDETEVLKPRSGAKRAYDLLRDEIVDLVLEPGSPIDEVQLAKRLSISRTPVREALARLSAEGLVTTLPNRSTMVANIDFVTLHTFFDAMTLMNRVTARLAAEYHDDNDLKTIRAQQGKFAQAVQDQDALAMIATNRDFHVAIAAAGRNPYYQSLFTRLLDEGRRILRLYYRSFQDQLPEQYVKEHEQLILAIANRDIDLADRQGLEHANQIVVQIQGLIAGDFRKNIKL